MAKAGFYFSGNGAGDDSATCFVCDKTLDGWERNDDPWVEHEKHSSNCSFVKMRKSEDELTVSQQLNN
jgi:baculoviral IAP repeat-containing protein 5